MVGHFRAGEVEGPVWILDPDNVGHLYTHLDSPQPSLQRELFTGDTVLWIYPDLNTALRSTIGQCDLKLASIKLVNLV